MRANVNSSVLPLPLAHAYGLLVFCGGFHRDEGARTVLMRWFDPAGWVKLAEEHQVQGSALVPSMIQMLLGQPLEQADLSALTAISSGASPLPEEARREFEKRVRPRPSTRDTAARSRPRSSPPTPTARGTEELSEHARKHLGANKYPRQITIVPAIPLTSVGKLDRKKLRQWVAEGI